MRRPVVSRDGEPLVYLYRTTSRRNTFDMAYRVTPAVHPSGLGAVIDGTRYDAMTEVLAVIARHDARAAQEQADAAEHAAHQEAWYQRYKAANGYNCPRWIDWALGDAVQPAPDVTACGEARP